MDLNEMLVFTRVVQAGSFVGAARQLGMPKTTVSRRVSELEERLGARLLHRSTRKLRLTDVGETFYRRASRVVVDAEEAELAVLRMQEVPRGRLRVTAPLNFGFLGPMVTSFLAAFPEVDVDLLCADRVVDLIDEGFDVAIRVGPLADSSLIVRSLGALQSYLVASPAFVERHGVPEAPEAIARFPCVVFSAGREAGAWRLSSAGRKVTVVPSPRLVANDFDFLDDAVLAGAGLALIPSFRCQQYLGTGRMVRVLPEWCTPDIAMHAVYPSSRHLSPKVKALVDHLRAELVPPDPARA